MTYEEKVLSVVRVMIRCSASDYKTVAEIGERPEEIIDSACRVVDAIGEKLQNPILACPCCDADLAVLQGALAVVAPST